MNALLEREIGFSGKFLAALGVAAVTGAITFFFTEHSRLEQILILGHTLAGCFIAALLLPYVVIHFRRTQGLRRPGLVVSGIVLSMAVIINTISGGDITIRGHREDSLLSYDWHIYSSILIVLLLIVHLVAHAKFMPARRRANQDGSFRTLRVVRIWSFAASLGFVLFSLLVVGLNELSAIPYTTKPLVNNYEYPYGPHPFRPSETETPGRQFVDERAISNSNDCIECHHDIGEQWLASAHRMAASDKSYATNVKLLAGVKGISATRFCEGCHAPIALLSGALTPGGYHGGMAGTLANREGLSCLACHRITRIVHTKGVASYEYTPMTPYLFDTADNFLLRQINHLLIRLHPDQHKGDMAPNLMKESAYCATCHALFIDKELNGWGWIKLYDEYAAWLDSPYAGQNEARFAQSELIRCQDCHMPLVGSDDPSADNSGRVRDHRFIGSNTMLPTLNGDSEQLERTRRFLQSDKMRISIEKPHRVDATQNLMPIDESLREKGPTPWYYYKGEEAHINVIVSNTGVGHSFPGGTIDINQAWVEFRVVDAEGTQVYSSGFIDGDGVVDSGAYFYRSLPVGRDGRLIWKHDLFNKVGEISRNVIEAGESDIVGYDFVVPQWVKAPLAVSAVLRYRKFNNRYARWALEDEYQELPIVDMARAYLTLPVRDRKEAF